LDWRGRFPTKSRLRNKILLHFFTNTDDEMYLREIVLILKKDPGNLSKALSKLEKESIFYNNSGASRNIFS